MNPKLPDIPEPPHLDSDPRQRRTDVILSAVVHQLTQSGKVQLGFPARARTGYPAAAVDLGRLQSEMSEALAWWPMDLVHQHWVDVEEWLLRLLETWVQRVKAIQLTPCTKGVHIHLETQDDHGYYTYKFDFFPGSSAPHSPAGSDRDRSQRAER